MNDLTARLQALLRLHAAADAEGDVDNARLTKQFRKGLQLLITEYGPTAVDAALDDMPDEWWPSISLH